MAMTAAERARKYRKSRDQDPDRRREFLLRQRLRYQHDKSVGKRKLVSEMSNREQRRQRRYWRRQQEVRRRKVRIMKSLKTVTPSVPPKDQSCSSLVPGQQINSRSTKARRRQNNRVYRENISLKEELKAAKRRSELYKKRWIREIEKSRFKQHVDTPKTKTRKLLRVFSGGKSTKTARKTLEFHNSLVTELSDQYKNGNNREKQRVSKIVTGHTMKKYNLICHARRELGLSKDHGHRVKKRSLTCRLEDRIRKFYERDDISRIVPGIKRTITQNKQKKQKRFLTDDLINIHKKFQNENNDISISYTSFCRQRPFWVVRPRDSDRETCACRIHENMALVVDALDKKQLLSTDKPSLLANLSVCDMKNKDCMYGDCINCKSRKLIQQTYDKTENIIYRQWETKVEDREIRKEIKQVTITSIVEIKSTLGELVAKFESQLKRFKVHLFNIENQTEYYRNLQSTMKDDELLIHIDFSENYVCKSLKEIQESRYGASKRQLTIHTGVYYTSSTEKPVSFATVSDSLQHGPAGVWAFLNPVLDDIKNLYPSIQHIHFFSDGPFSQYRQKNNFYYFSTELAAKGFSMASWNFHEAGHGKGAPDGVGGSLKRAADMRILHGGTIENASSFIRELRETDSSVILYEVSQEEVDKKEKELPALKTVPGTSKLHQVITQTPGQLLYRDISCYCTKDNPHVGHDFKQFHFNISCGKDRDGLSKKRKNIETTDRAPQKVNMRNIVNGDCEMPQTADRVQHEILKDRKEFYKKHLSQIATCKTFNSLFKLCEKIDVLQKASYIIDTDSRNPKPVELDENALKHLPHDFINSEDLYPVAVLGDGNCLPYSGSIIAFGNPDHGDEMRVRIVVEQVLYKKLYLSESHLQRGLVSPSRHSIAKIFAMYSEEYIPGVHILNKPTIEKIYQMEALKITRLGSFMGMWQLCALASVLGKKLVSVHPKKGNLNIRKDLHRTIEPRISSSNPNDCAYIMWTSARRDMSKGHWQANHFVPLLAFQSAKSEKSIRKAEKSFYETTDKQSVNTNGTKYKGLKRKVNLEVQKIIEQRSALISLRRSKKERNSEVHNK